jgi:hypothetical protein
MNDVMNEIVHQQTFHLLHFLQLNILYFLFGILIQRKKVEQILTQKSIQPNRLILPAFFLVAIALIPNPFWTDWFGHQTFASILLLSPLTNGDTHSIIGVLSGLLFIKALD